MNFQKTIKKEIRCQGIGIHSGKHVSMTIKPAKIDTGINFIRTDLKNKPIIEANLNNVFNTYRSTSIKDNDAIIMTIEHFLSACFSLSITNLEIEINNEELPILDGGAKKYVDLLIQSGLKKQAKENKKTQINRYIKVSENESSIEYFPSKNFEIVVNIDYQSSILTAQSAELKKIENFPEEIAPAKTFCFFKEIDELKNKGLIKGGTLKNTIVFLEKDSKNNKFKKGILNRESLTFNNEPARHKILDLIGDLSLIKKILLEKLLLINLDIV